MNKIVVFTAGEAIAESVFMTLVEHNLHEKVMGAVADTTAPNFGQWRGAMVILQVLRGCGRASVALNPPVKRPVPGEIV